MTMITRSALTHNTSIKAVRHTKFHTGPILGSFTGLHMRVVDCGSDIHGLARLLRDTDGTIPVTIALRTAVHFYKLTQH